MAKKSVLYDIPMFLPMTSGNVVFPGLEEALSKIDDAEFVRSTLLEADVAGLFAEKGASREFETFLETGRSAGRAMQFVRFTIEAQKSFRLHAHPGIEVVVVARGSVFERRLKRLPTKDFPDAATFPFSLAHLTEDDFDTFRHHRGKVFVNEVGSCHRSYTADEGCELFALWSGCHADVPDHFTPTSERVTGAVS